MTAVLAEGEVSAIDDEVERRRPARQPEADRIADAAVVAVNVSRVESEAALELGSGRRIYGGAPRDRMTEEMRCFPLA